MRKTQDTKNLLVQAKKYLVKDLETGEERIEEFSLASIESRDFNYNKVWVATLFYAFNIIGGAKIKVATWIIENRSKENYIIASIQEIAEQCGASAKSVQETIAVLKKLDIIKMHKKGTYQLNPDVVFKGSHSNRMNVWLKYGKPDDSAKSSECSEISNNNKKEIVA